MELLCAEVEATKSGVLMLTAGTTSCKSQSLEIGVAASDVSIAAVPAVSMWNACRAALLAVSRTPSVLNIMVWIGSRSCIAEMRVSAGLA